MYLASKCFWVIQSFSGQTNRRTDGRTYVHTEEQTDTEGKPIVPSGIELISNLDFRKISMYVHFNPDLSIP